MILQLRAASALDFPRSALAFARARSRASLARRGALGGVLRLGGVDVAAEQGPRLAGPRFLWRKKSRCKRALFQVLKRVCCFSSSIFGIFKEIDFTCSFMFFGGRKGTWKNREVFCTPPLSSWHPPSLEAKREALGLLPQELLGRRLGRLAVWWVKGGSRVSQGLVNQRGFGGMELVNHLHHQLHAALQGGILWYTSIHPSRTYLEMPFIWDLASLPFAKNMTKQRSKGHVFDNSRLVECLPRGQLQAQPKLFRSDNLPLCAVPGDTIRRLFVRVHFELVIC